MITLPNSIFYFSLLYWAASPLLFATTEVAQMNKDQKEKIVLKLQQFKTITEQNITMMGPVADEACTFLIDNYDQNFLSEIITFYRSYMKFENTHHLFFDLIAVEKKYPQQLHKIVKELLTPGEQQDFWQRLEVAKREIKEGNG